MFSDDEPELDTAIAGAVRRAYVRPVDEATAEEHVSAMAAAAAGSAAEATGGTTRRGRGWRIGLAAGFATLALPVGLAAAGVALPDVLSGPFGAVGVELPNQPADTREAPAPPPPAGRPTTPLTPLHPVAPATGKPSTPAEQGTSRPESGRGRAARKGVRKPARRAAPPRSRRSVAPGRAAPARPAKPLTPRAVPRRSVRPQAPARPKSRTRG